jgi:membrane protein DedA with SNARE-associated domain
MSAATAAFGTGDVVGVVGLLLSALVGSMIGDLLVFALGRSSNRIVHSRLERDCALGGWVRRTMFSRPVVALVGARFVPGGRLVSTAAAGRVRLPFGSFLAGSSISSALWAAYMLVVGLLLGPIVGGNPLLCLGAGVVMAVLTAGGFALVHRLRAVRSRHVERSRAAGVRRPQEPAFGTAEL